MVKRNKACEICTNHANLYNVEAEEHVTIWGCVCKIKLGALDYFSTPLEKSNAGHTVTRKCNFKFCVVPMLQSSVNDHLCEKL